MLNTHAFGTAKCRRTSSHCASSSVSSRVSRVCSTAQGSSSTAVASARGKASKVPLVVYFKEDKKTVEALPGEFIAEVAARAGVDIQLGCNQGNCGVCEVELEKFSPLITAAAGEATPSPSSPAASSSAAAGGLQGGGPCVVRACVARLPPGYPLVEIGSMGDAVWGVDGFDT